MLSLFYWHPKVQIEMTHDMVGNLHHMVDIGFSLISDKFVDNCRDGCSPKDSEYGYYWI